MLEKLLTRDQFRETVLSRHAGKCCVPDCLIPAVDAHHILNRNLYVEAEEFGGYFFGNGANLCSAHHLQAEQTLIRTKDLYAWCQIDTPATPRHLSPDLEYDTWGNVWLDAYNRLKGELWDDEGCQKALRAAHVLWMFS